MSEVDFEETTDTQSEMRAQLDLLREANERGELVTLIVAAAFPDKVMSFVVGGGYEDGEPVDALLTGLTEAGKTLYAQWWSTREDDDLTALPVGTIVELASIKRVANEDGEPVAADATSVNKPVVICEDIFGRRYFDLPPELCPSTRAN